MASKLQLQSLMHILWFYKGNTCYQIGFRSLFDRLQEQKDKKQAEWDESHKLKNQVNWPFYKFVLWIWKSVEKFVSFLWKPDLHTRLFYWFQFLLLFEIEYLSHKHANI